MGLSVVGLELEEFRSYQKLQLNELGKLTVFMGPNAVGKTNLLEAIQLVTALQSFRSPHQEHLIRQGSSFGRVKATFEGDGRTLVLEFDIFPDKKQYLLNGKPRRASLLKTLLPAVMFNPDDLELVKGSQGKKRDQIDQVAGQLSSNYRAVRRDYEKILRQKNRCLKNDEPKEYLESINDVLCRIGAQVSVFRQDLAFAIDPYLTAAYRELAPDEEEARILYVPSWKRHDLDYSEFSAIPLFDRGKAHQNLTLALESEMEREYESHRSLVGPHADRFEFYIGSHNARIFASQGQQRSLVLAYKVACAKLLEKRCEQPPVILLDDVMSELDERRRVGLTSLISGFPQTFITATNAEALPEGLIDQAEIIELG